MTMHHRCCVFQIKLSFILIKSLHCNHYLGKDTSIHTPLQVVLVGLSMNIVFLSVDSMYTTLCDCQILHPDADDSFSDGW